MDVNQTRLTIFLSLFVVLAITEFLAPRRFRSVSRTNRWSKNILLTAFGSLLGALTIGAIPMAVAHYAVTNQIGLLPWLGIDGVIGIIATYVLLDFAIYQQHIMFHAVPLLWRLHKVHHSDPDLDVTSGSRFHPIEIFLSLIIKIAAVLVIGADPMGVIVFEILLNGGSLFNHSNIKIPPKIEKFIRLLVVTPDIHIIHHSVNRHETNSNFGFTISVWDRIFGTYRAHPDTGVDRVTIGLTEYSNPAELTLTRLLLLPFEDKGQSYSMDEEPETQLPRAG